MCWQLWLIWKLQLKDWQPFLNFIQEVLEPLDFESIALFVMIHSLSLFPTFIKNLSDYIYLSFTLSIYLFHLLHWEKWNCLTISIYHLLCLCICFSCYIQMNLSDYIYLSLTLSIYLSLLLHRNEFDWITKLSNQIRFLQKAELPTFSLFDHTFQIFPSVEIVFPVKT